MKYKARKKERWLYIAHPSFFYAGCFFNISWLVPNKSPYSRKIGLDFCTRTCYTVNRVEEHRKRSPPHVAENNRLTLEVGRRLFLFIDVGENNCDEGNHEVTEQENLLQSHKHTITPLHYVEGGKKFAPSSGE